MSILFIQEKSDDKNNLTKINPNLKKVNRKMIEWLLINNTKIHSLEINDNTSNRFVMTKQTISKNDIILQVPFDMIISSILVNKSEIVNLIKEKYIFRSSHSNYACFLLEESLNPLSKWKCYLESLPDNYSTIPIYYDQKQLDELEGSMTIKKINDKKMELLMEYSSVIKAYPEFYRFSYEKFIYFRCVVITRIFGFEIARKNNPFNTALTIDDSEEKEKCDGLVPFADMLNHKVEKDTSWYFDDETKCFTIKALKKIKMGYEVFDSYGRKCNSRFFVNYGFTLENNQQDNQALFIFNQSMFEGTTEFKNLDKKLLESKLLFLGFDKRQTIYDFQIPTEYNYETTQLMFSTLRVLCSTIPEFKILINNKNLDRKKIEVISLSNEIKVLKLINEIAQLALSKFKTTVKEDEIILQDSSINIYLRNSVIMRKSEKEVLIFYIELCTHYYYILTNIDKVPFGGNAVTSNKKLKKLNNKFKYATHDYAKRCINKFLKD